MQPGVLSQLWIWKATWGHVKSFTHAFYLPSLPMMLPWSSLEVVQTLVVFYSLCCINSYFWNALGCWSDSFSVLWRGLKQPGRGNRVLLQQGRLCQRMSHTATSTARCVSHRALWVSPASGCGTGNVPDSSSLHSIFPGLTQSRMHPRFPEPQERSCACQRSLFSRVLLFALVHSSLNLHPAPRRSLGALTQPTQPSREHPAIPAQSPTSLSRTHALPVSSLPGLGMLSHQHSTTEIHLTRFHTVQPSTIPLASHYTVLIMAISLLSLT